MLINESQISIFDTQRNDFFPQEIRMYKCVKDDKKLCEKEKKKVVCFFSPIFTNSSNMDFKGYVFSDIKK